MVRNSTQWNGWAEAGGTIAGAGGHGQETQAGPGCPGPARTRIARLVYSRSVHPQQQVVFGLGSRAVGLADRDYAAVGRAGDLGDLVRRRSELPVGVLALDRAQRDRAHRVGGDPAVAERVGRQLLDEAGVVEQVLVADRQRPVRVNLTVHAREDVAVADRPGRQLLDADGGAEVGAGEGAGDRGFAQRSGDDVGGEVAARRQRVDARGVDQVGDAVGVEPLADRERLEGRIGLDVVVLDRAEV